MHKNPFPLLILPLGLSWLAACGNDSGTHLGKSALVSTDDGDGDGDGNLHLPLDITPAAPAFYDAEGVVEVSGYIDGSVLDIEELTVDGVSVGTGTGMSFRHTVVLADGEPWRIVPIFARDATGRTGEVKVQVARATASDAAEGAWAETDAGPAGLDRLVLHVGSFVRDDNLAPPAQDLLRRSCRAVSEGGVEMGNITETLRLTGTAHLESFQGGIDTDDEAMLVDAGGTRIIWDAEVVGEFSGTTLVRSASFAVDLTAGDAIPTALCDTEGRVVTRAPETATLTASFDWPPNCFVASEAEALAAPAFAAVVPPEIDRASCAWSLWLDDALATTLDGVDFAPTSTVDRAGLQLSFAASPVDPPPVLIPSTLDLPSADQVLGSVAASVLGPALHSSVARTRTVLLDGTLDGQAAKLTRTEGHLGVTTLVRDDAGTLTSLPVPIGFTLVVDGSECAAGHVIPAPVPVALESTDNRTNLSIIAQVDGADTENTCGISAAAWQTVLADVLASAWDGNGAVLTVADGLVRLGASTTFESTASGMRVEVEVPTP